MKLKTKIISAICAGALALSMPAMAFAAVDSPFNTPTDSKYGPIAVNNGNGITNVTFFNAKDWVNFTAGQADFDNIFKAAKDNNLIANDVATWGAVSVDAKWNGAPGTAKSPVTVCIYLNKNAKGVSDLQDGAYYKMIHMKDAGESTEYPEVISAQWDSDAACFIFSTTSFSPFMPTNAMTGAPAPGDEPTDVIEGENTEDGMPTTGIAA